MKNNTNNLFTRSELNELCLEVGQNVSIHRSVLIFGNELSIGSNVRIDAGCIITSKERVEIGNHVHLAAGVYLFGSEGIVIEDYAGLSSRVSIYTTSDDYSGGALTNPTVPEHFRSITRGAVYLKKHAIVGANSVIMPGVVLGRGCSVGALSFVNKSISENMIVSGNPIRKISTRDGEKLQKLEATHKKEK